MPREPLRTFAGVVDRPFKYGAQASGARADEFWAPGVAGTKSLWGEMYTQPPATRGIVKPPFGAGSTILPVIGNDHSWDWERQRPPALENATGRTNPAWLENISFSGDNSNAGVVNPHLFGNRSNRDFWEQPASITNRPHEAFDVPPSAFGLSDAVPANRPHSAMDYTDPAPPNRPHEALDYLAGDMPVLGFTGGGTPGTDYTDSIGEGPNVGSRQVTPVATPNQPHVAMDYNDPPPQNRPHEAVDFYDTVQNRPHEAIAVNPAGLPGNPGLDDGPNLFDEWRRSDTPSVAVTTTTNAGDGGSIWQGDTSLSDFGGDLTVGNDVSTTLGDLGYGTGYPDLTLAAIDPHGDMTPPGNPAPPYVDPAVLPEPDNEWTRSDNDRRFLPEPSPSPEAQGERTTVSGLNLNTFGVPPGNELSLGAFLNTPLTNMRFGDNYPPVDRGRIIVGGVEQDTGGTTDIPQYGPEMTDRQLADMDAARHRNMQSTPPDWRSNAQSNTSPIAGDTTPPPGMEIVGTDKKNGQFVYKDKKTGRLFVNPGTGTPIDPTGGLLTNRQYERATFGGLTPIGFRDPRGSAVGNLPENSRNFNAMLMAAQAFGGTPNLNQPDEVSRRLGQRGHLDESGQYVQDGFIGGDYTPETFRAFVYGSNHRDLPASRVAPRGRGR